MRRIGSSDGWSGVEWDGNCGIMGVGVVGHGSWFNGESAIGECKYDELMAYINERMNGHTYGFPLSIP